MDQRQGTFIQAVEGYFIAANAHHLAPGTLANCDNTFHRFETWLDDNPPLADITPTQIRTFLGSLNGLSAKTVANNHVGLSAHGLGLLSLRRPPPPVPRLAHNFERPNLPPLRPPARRPSCRRRSEPPTSSRRGPPASARRPTLGRTCLRGRARAFRRCCSPGSRPPRKPQNTGLTGQSVEPPVDFPAKLKYTGFARHGPMHD
jgi:hypothetical protein